MYQRSFVPTHWQSVADAIPDGRITQDAADSCIANWKSLLGGARQRPSDGHWIIVVYDVVDGDLDTAPELHTSVGEKTDIPKELISLGTRLIETRESRHSDE